MVEENHPVVVAEIQMSRKWKRGMQIRIRIWGSKAATDWKKDSSIFRGASSEKVNVSPDAYKRKAIVTGTTRERYNPATGNIHLYENGKPTGETRKAGPMEKYEYKKGRLPGI